MSAGPPDSQVDYPQLNDSFTPSSKSRKYLGKKDVSSRKSKKSDEERAKDLGQLARAGVGEEGIVIDSLSQIVLTMHRVPGPVLGGKDKAVSKAARKPSPWKSSLSMETRYNQSRKSPPGHHGAGWHTREAGGAGRVWEEGLVFLGVREGKSREPLS